MKLTRGQTGGLIEKAESFEGLWLRETWCAPNHQASKHSHELFQFYLVRAGAFTEHRGRKARECVTYSLSSHLPDEVHSSVYHCQGARSFIIEIDGRWLELAREHSVVLESVHFKGGLSVWLAQRLYNEFRSMDEVSPLVIEGLTLELMAASTRQSAGTIDGKPPRWLAQAMEILRDDFTKAVSLRRLAETIGVHPVHLARTFRKHNNCTVGEYARRVRIEAACHELSLTDDPLSKIAVSVGYYDQSHFTRNFKKLMGMMPTKYRAVFRQR